LNLTKAALFRVRRLLWVNVYPNSMSALRPLSTRSRPNRGRFATSVSGQKAASHRFVKNGLYNSAEIAHVLECEGKSQKLTSHARLIKAIHDGVVNSLPEILANFGGPVWIGGEYHGNLPQVGLSNQRQPTVAVLAVTKLHFCCTALTCQTYFQQFLNFMSGEAPVSQHGTWATSRHRSCHNRSSQTGSF
jgi:hypothetical protein